MTAWGAYLVKSSRNLNTPKAEVGIGLMMPAHHSSRCDFHFWILLLLFIASPQGTVLKIQVKSCWKSLADRLLQEFIMFSFVDISFLIYTILYHLFTLLTFYYTSTLYYTFNFHLLFSECSLTFQWGSYFRSCRTHGISRSV